MPYFERGNARLYFEDVGAGPAIMTTHGLSENHLYWSLPGVIDQLTASGYRVISTDMRGHGRSKMSGEPKGYDIDTIAGDFDALADHLGLNRFHLLTHATGGMAGLRYAMAEHRRLLSVMSTNTGSATIPTDGASEITDPGGRFDQFLDRVPNQLAASFRGRTWYQIVKGARDGSTADVFLNRMHLAINPEAAFAWYEACVRLGDPDTLADFMSVFYSDPDPHIAGLRGISCPCLVLVGEHDRMFLKPSEQLAREIPNATHIVLGGRGHMTALEDPQRVAHELLTFLAAVSDAGHLARDPLL